MSKKIMTVLAAVIAVIMSATVLNSVAFAAETNTGDNLKSGKYAVDISWSPMGAMFSPVLEIDVEKDTFKVYNATAPDASKGAGSIAFADGVYTLTYENGSKTTFTYDAASNTITFTSALYYGMASFNNLDDSGNFVTYTAKVKTETPSESETNSENTTEAETTTETETTAEATTEAESKSEDNGLQSPDTGDTANGVFLFAACMIASAAIVGLTAVKRRDA